MSFLSKDIFTKRVAEKVRMAREKKKMSQEALAHEANLYRTYINHIEAGRYSPSAYVIYKIAKALGINASELLPSS